MKTIPYKFKNPYFYIGLVAVMIAASGIDFEAFTTWSLLADGLLSIVQNPVKLIAVLIAGLGVIMNPNTKGIN